MQAITDLNCMNCEALGIKTKADKMVVNISDGDAMFRYTLCRKCLELWQNEQIELIENNPEDFV